MRVSVLRVRVRVHVACVLRGVYCAIRCVVRSMLRGMYCVAYACACARLCVCVYVSDAPCRAVVVCRACLSFPSPLLPLPHHLSRSLAHIVHVLRFFSFFPCV